MFFDEEVLDRLSARLPGGIRPVSVLGQGGCGVVVCVQSDGFSDQFAMKIAWKGNEEQILREQQALQCLRGVNGVVKLLEQGQEPAPYFMCEVVSGQTMDAYLKRGRVTVERALRLLARLADIVGGIHARGIVHRDLKPENVIVKWGKTPSPVVIDFGLAMRYGYGELPDSVTGTLSYMAPVHGMYMCVPCGYVQEFQEGVLFTTCELCLAGTDEGPEGYKEAETEFWELIS